MGRDIFNSVKLLRSPSSPALNVSRDGASTTSLCNLSDFLSPEWLQRKRYRSGELNTSAPSVPQHTGGFRASILGNHSLLRSAVLPSPRSVLQPVLQSLQLSPQHYSCLHTIRCQASHSQCHCSLSCTKNVERCYLFSTNKAHIVTVLLVLPRMQYIQTSRNHTQKRCKQNPMNLYKYVAVVCKHCKYYIFLWC